MSSTKPRVRLWHVGQATFRRVAKDKGWGGPYGQNRRPARWACVDCGAVVRGSDEQPEVYFNPWSGRWDSPCANNGHAPCKRCGKPLARLNDGCPREHAWHRCPRKSKLDRMNPQHAAAGHLGRQP